MDNNEHGTNLAEVGTDCISRQAAIDALHMHLMYRMGTDSNKKRLDEWINNLPSAQPERKRGKWIVDRYGIVICSECRKPRRDNRIDHIGWCNGCGAKMEVTT